MLTVAPLPCWPLIVTGDAAMNAIKPNANMPICKSIFVFITLSNKKFRLALDCPRRVFVNKVSDREPTVFEVESIET
jgi:hypothetical protein